MFSNQPRAVSLSRRPLTPPSSSSSYVPGMYKIFDEILVNASDNKQRDSSMNMLKVDVSGYRLQ